MQSDGHQRRQPPPRQAPQGTKVGLGQLGGPPVHALRIAPQLMRRHDVGQGLVVDIDQRRRRAQHARQVRARQVGRTELGPGDHRPPHGGVGQIGLVQVRARQVRPVHHRADHASAHQARAGHHRVAEVHGRHHALVADGGRLVADNGVVQFARAALVAQNPEARGQVLHRDQPPAQVAVGEVRAREVGAPEAGAAHVGAHQAGAAQVRVTQVRAVEPRLVELRARQQGAGEPRADHLRVAQVRVIQGEVAEIQVAEVRAGAAGQALHIARVERQRRLHRGVVRRAQERGRTNLDRGGCGHGPTCRAGV